MSLNCAWCERPLGEALVRFGRHPIAGGLSMTREAALNARKYELDWYFCGSCSFFQQHSAAFQRELLEEIYPQQLNTYGMLPWVREYMQQMIGRVRERFGGKGKVLEVGCNDGSALDMFRNAGFSPYGIEPGEKMVEACRALNLEVVHDFLSAKNAGEMVARNGQMDVILIRHVLEHVLNLKEFLIAVRGFMHERSTLIIEVPSILEILRNHHIDGMTHPHVSMFSVTSLEHMLREVGLFLHDVATVPTDGGSILMWWKTVQGEPSASVLLQRKAEEMRGLRKADTYRALQAHFDATSAAMGEFAGVLRRGKPCVGYGAGAKGSAILNWFGLTDAIPVVVDRAPAKVGTWVPGTGQRVVSMEEALALDPEWFAILAPTHTAAILARERTAFAKARAFTILPELSVVSV